MKNLTDRLYDPLNRVYRIRIANFLVDKLMSTSITPNAVTLFHALIGVISAVLVFQKYYILAAIMLEFRALLDCIDGVLARKKGLESRFGRLLDTFADGISFNSLMLAGAMRMMADFPIYKPSLIFIIVFLFALIAAHCGIIHQFMRKKLIAVFNQELDPVESEWREHRLAVQSEPRDLISRIGLWLDSVTIRFISEEWFEKIERRLYRENWKELSLKDSHTMNDLARTTRKREVRRAVNFISLLSDDNVFVVIAFCLFVLGLFPTQIFPFVHPVLIAFSCGFVYAIVTLMLAMHYFQNFYHGVYRE